MKNPDREVSGKRCSTVKTRKAKDKLRQRKGKREETRRKEKKKEKRKTIIKMEQMWSNQRNLKLVKSEKP